MIASNYSILREYPLALSEKETRLKHLEDTIAQLQAYKTKAPAHKVPVIQILINAYSELKESLQ